MSKIPTAEEFYKQITGCVMNHGDIKKAMIEFAKLHLEAQKKAILKNAKLKKVNFWGGTEIDKNSILNSYPLDKIQ